jgi:putative ABC transport system permease protein
LINRFFDISLSLASLSEVRTVFAIVVTIIVVGMISAAYPAFFTSSVNVSAGIKGRHSLPGTAQIRQSLLVLQFGIAAIAIASTFIVRSQMNFLSSQPLGFDKEQTIVLDATGLSDKDLYALRDQVINSYIKLASVVGAEDYPGGKATAWQLVWTFTKGNKVELAVNTFYVDEYFQDVLRIPLVAGRLFQPQSNRADYMNAIIVNERFVQRMGWTTEEAIGQRIEVFNYYWNIIGVAKDFHYQSLGSEIEPLFMAMVNKQWPPEKKLLVKVASKIDIDYVQAKWKSTAQAPFNYTFLDEDFSKYYRNELALTRMATYFSGISLFLAAVGLIGLASLLTVQRTKEIGIRKVMGATNAGMFFLLFKNFIVLACIGYLISIPLTWVVMRSWLAEFPLRISLGILSFIIPGVIIFSVTLLTTSFQILRGAKTNPVDSLRHE